MAFSLLLVLLLAAIIRDQCPSVYRPHRVRLQGIRFVSLSACGDFIIGSTSCASTQNELFARFKRSSHAAHACSCAAVGRLPAYRGPSLQRTDPGIWNNSPTVSSLGGPNCWAAGASTARNSKHTTCSERAWGSRRVHCSEGPLYALLLYV